MICDVPFRLTASFEPNAGLFLYRPTNSAMMKELLLPLVLRDVKLVSDSKALPQRKDAISNIISQKYMKGKALGGVTQIKDATGTIFSVMHDNSQDNVSFFSHI